VSIRGARESNRAKIRCGNRLGVFDDSLVNQHDGYVVPNWVHSAAGGALKALRRLPMFERRLAGRANQDGEQFVGDHSQNSTPVPVQIGNRGSPLATV